VGEKRKVVVLGGGIKMQYSVVQTTELDEIVFRLDAEFYHPEHLALQAKLARFNSISISDAGGILDCSAFYPSIVPYYNFDKIGIPFLRVNEIQNGLLHISQDTAFLPQEILDENPTTIARCIPGDLIIAKGGNSLAKVALLTEEYQHYSVCRDVIVLRTSEFVDVNRFYLWMFLHSSIGQKILLRTASQTGQPHLTLDAIKQIEIPLFTNDFQSEFEWLYRESQRLKHESEKLYYKGQELLLSELGLINWQPKHQLAFIKYFSDTEQAERIDAEYYQPKYEEIEDAIKSYKGGYSTIGNEFDQNKSTFKIDDKKTYKYVEIGSVNVTNGEVTPNVVIGEELPANAKRVLKINDVIVSKVRTYRGAITIVEENGCVGSGAFTVLRENGRINKETLLAFLHSKPLLAWSLKPNTGTSYPVIIDDDILNLPIPLLPEKKQLEIQRKVNESFNLRKRSKQLLESAKKAVEMAIEQDEQTAIDWLKVQTKSIGVIDANGL